MSVDLIYFLLCLSLLVNKLNNMSYSMAQIETLTGINAHTLRIWERRYNFLLPSRTATNIRYYSDEQLRRLLNVAVLIRNGYRVSKIDKMQDHEIHDLVNEILLGSDTLNDDDINRLVFSMLELDENAFNQIYQRNITRKGLLACMMELIYPFLKQVGVLWMNSKAIPSQEHFISNLVRQKISAAIDSLPNPSADAPTILLFLLEGEFHEIGLLMANYIAKDLGWKVYYLGAHVPLENVITTQKIINAQLMMTMFIVPRAQEMDEILKPLISDINIPLIVSTKENLNNQIGNIKNLINVTSPEEFISYLNKVNDSSL